jgi:hypothetical protein
MVSAKIVIPQGKNVKIAIGLHQKQQRFYHKVKGFKPQMARILLAKYLPNSSSYEFISSDSNDNEKLYIEIDDLAPGEYHIFCNVNWPYETKCRYTISTYASIPVDIKNLEINNVPTDYLEQILGHYMDMNCKNSKMTETAYYKLSTNDNDTGFYMAYFENKEKSEALKVNFACGFNDKIVFMNVTSVTDRHLTRQDNINNDSFNFIVAPGAKKMLIWRLLGNPWQAKMQPSNLSCQNVDYQETHMSETLPQTDNCKLAVEGVLKSLWKENLSLDCFYSEVDIEDGVLVIFENKSKMGLTYRFKTAFKNLRNLEIDGRGLMFNVQAGQFNYIRLRKIDQSKDYSYGMTYSFKKF